MPGQEEKEILIQLAELRQQMNAVNTSVDEIKMSVREVVQLDRTIAELGIHYQQQAREIQTQWRKIDENHKDTESVDKKADEWINKAHGAWWMAILFGSLIQAGVLGMIAWTFMHVRTAEDGILLLNHRVIQLEQQQKGYRP